MGFDDMGFDGFDNSGGFNEDDFGGGFGGGDGFGNSGGFGGNNFGGGDDPFGDFAGGGGNSGGTSRGFDNFGGSEFGDMNPSGGINQNNGQAIQQGNEFENMFNSSADPADDANSKENLKKTAIVAAIVGVIIIILVIVGAALIGKKNKSKETITASGVTIIEQPQQSNNGPTQLPSQNPNEILQSGNEPSSNINATIPGSNTSSSGSGWTLVDDKQNVVFEGDYRELVFCVNEIEHRAKKSASTLIIETIATGSLSGMSGTYELKIPYHKGVRLYSGAEIGVYVLVGDYNGTTVIGDIKYK